MRSIIIFFTLLINNNSFCQTLNGDSIIEQINLRIKKHEGKKIDTFFGKTPFGKNFSNVQLLGKTTLLNFWFEACPPCIHEIPILNKINSQFKKRENFQIVGVTFDSYKSILQNVKKHKIQYPIIQLSKGKCDSLNFNLGYPVIIVINNKGIIEYIKAGGANSMENAFKYFEDFILPKLDLILNKSD